MISLVASLLLTVAATAVAKEVPGYIQLCKRNTPDFSGCVRKSIDHLRPYLATGIPEINVPPLEPLYLEELVAVQGKGIRVAAKDIKAYGSSDFAITHLMADPENLILESEVTHPHLFIEGTYSLEGKLLLLPLSGSGPMRANLTKCTGRLRMKAELIKNDAGETHMYYTDFDIKTTVGKGNIHFGNLFGGDPVLGDTVNSAINGNFDIFMREIGPVVEKALAEAFRKIANDIAASYSFEQLFPEN